MGHSAVVIGGASGIGAAVAARFAAEGYDVTVADLQAGEGVVAVDVTDEASVAALFDAVMGRAGRIDVVVNTAGVSNLMRIVDHDVAEFRRIVDVSLTGSMIVIKHAAQRMNDGGAIISLSSLNGRQPGAGMAAYCSAKAGINLLTQVAALELGPRQIRVNAIAPGIVVTPLTAPAMDIPGIEDDYLANTPLGRSGTVEEIAEAALYIAGAKWLTGEVLDLNGGAHLMRYPDLPGHVEAAFGL